MALKALSLLALLAILAMATARWDLNSTIARLTHILVVIL
jgi:hypothetical protein